MDLSSAVALILSISVTTFLVLRSWSSPRVAGRATSRWVALALVVFSLVDWVLLEINISHAPNEVYTSAILLCRSGFYTAVAFSLALTKTRRAILNPTKLTNVTLVTLFAFELGALLLGVYALFIEPNLLRVTRLSLPEPRLLSDRPLRIVHLTDMHVKRTGFRERRLPEIVDSLNPDLIVLTGDYLYYDTYDDPLTIQDTHALLSQLHAPYGVFAVSGTPPRHSPDALAPLFEGLDIVFLNDQIHRLQLEIGDLYLVGLSNLGGQRDQIMLSQLMSQVPSTAYSLLLYHTPDILVAASEANVDLYLAGHTHGGQIHLPLYGALLKSAPAYNAEYDIGQYSLGSTLLYVNRGIGTEGLDFPRIRFLCPPEILLIELGKFNQ